MMRQIEKKTIPEPNRTLILSFGPFFKFYFGNLYGIIIIILHPHLNTRFPWHFQSKRILRTYHRTFFISCILAISMLFFNSFRCLFLKFIFATFILFTKIFSQVQSSSQTTIQVLLLFFEF